MSNSEYRMLIDGALVAATGGRTYENVNPANEEVIGVSPNAGVADVERAILAARRAFDTTTWSTDTEFRQRCLVQLQSALRKNAEEMRPVMVAEGGLPLALTYDVALDGSIEMISHYIDLLDTFEFERVITPVAGDEKAHRIVRREGAGVVAAITAWNYPIFLAIAKLIPALAAGCTVVLKPAPDTPWNTLEIGRILLEHTDIPAGVVNIVSTDDNDVASVLTTHPEVDAVTFTGSTVTGRRIMAAAAPTVKRLTLELGGKSSAILLDDADFTSAIPFVAATTLSHAGQGCGIYSRLLVPRARLDEAVEIAVASMQQIPWGDPTDIANYMGPLANKRQYESVLRYYEIAKQTGRIALGGKASDRFEKGFWVEPTVLTDVDSLSTVPQEEIFGPLLCVLPYEDDADAVAISNNTIYGLAGGVWSADVERAQRVAEGMRASSIQVNDQMWNHRSAPFGGYKQSGIGREWGVEGLEDLLEVKTIARPA
ncbi:UNVERIFIED_ORG: aldehyde dehydrogenase (NAD+) [Nocardia globerula]|uniref:Aldehyde dehydrogenase (NAD+) n=3 Tax=Nocardiaceae TaxID=85025 RepID=A0A652YGZ8_NOCGL|nr:aldehyde dehydrogenase family protein [Rhodococcus globerulus]NMD64423.1 aldehyde dehydrogenase family protein [Nocardia globerula]PVX63334.1 aldehyde dehydrogenase (NAD+) [Rhodococcus globerulus]